MLIQNERFCDCVGKGGWICYLVCLFTPVLAIFGLLLTLVVMAFI